MSKIQRNRSLKDRKDTFNLLERDMIHYAFFPGSESHQQSICISARLKL